MNIEVQHTKESNPLRPVMIDDLLLDSQLKWGMLLPISIAMVLVGLLRANLTVLFALRPKPDLFKKSREKYVVGCIYEKR